MQFNSIPFLFVFLPVFLAVYYISPRRLKNAALLLGSVLFYGMCIDWEPTAMLVLLAVTAVTYFAGRLIGKPRLRFCFWGFLVPLTAMLVFFKCYDGGKHLPAGMSFYLFQITAYLACVYRGTLEPEKNAVNYAASVWMFPKLLSGPMMSPVTLSEQLSGRKHSARELHNGLQLLILGLAMKVALANRVGGLWGQAGSMGFETVSAATTWLCLLSYVMKLYFDFFGYSLMAVGLGRMLGFRLPHNFMDPYAAGSVSEFYRRWHITLGDWFRENIYIPLGGNRKGLGRTVCNLLAVWVLTGLWHGVGGNYLLWAGILAFFIILEKLFLGRFLQKSRVLCHVYTVFVIVLSWVPFAIGDWGQLRIFFGSLFGAGTAAVPGDWQIWLEKFGLLLGLGALLMTPLPRRLWKKLENTWLADVLCFVLFWISVYYIATAAQDPFMYGQY